MSTIFKNENPELFDACLNSLKELDSQLSETNTELADTISDFKASEELESENYFSAVDINDDGIFSFEDCGDVNLFCDITFYLYQIDSQLAERVVDETSVPDRLLEEYSKALVGKLKQQDDDYVHPHSLIAENLNQFNENKVETSIVHYFDSTRQLKSFPYSVEQYFNTLRFHDGNFSYGTSDAFQSQVVVAHPNSADYFGEGTLSPHPSGRIYIPHPTGYEIVSLFDQNQKPIVFYRTDSGEFYFESKVKSKVTFGIAQQSSQTWATFNDQLTFNLQEIDPNVMSFIQNIKDNPNEQNIQNLAKYFQQNRNYRRDIVPNTSNANEQTLANVYYQESSCVFSAILTAHALNQVGVKVRVATGQLGELGRHAWVEAYVNENWIVVEGTPSQSKTSEAPTLATLVSQPAQITTASVERVLEAQTFHLNQEELPQMAISFLDATIRRCGTEEVEKNEILKKVHDAGVIGEFETAVFQAMTNSEQVEWMKKGQGRLVWSILRDEESGSELARSEDMLMHGEETFRASKLDYAIEGFLIPFDWSSTEAQVMVGGGVVVMGGLAMVFPPVAGTITILLTVGTAIYALGKLVKNGFEIGFSETDAESKQNALEFGEGAGYGLMSFPFMPKIMRSYRSWGVAELVSAKVAQVLNLEDFLVLVSQHFKGSAEEMYNFMRIFVGGYGRINGSLPIDLNNVIGRLLFERIKNSGSDEFLIDSDNPISLALIDLFRSFKKNKKGSARLTPRTIRELKNRSLFFIRRENYQTYLGKATITDIQWRYTNRETGERLFTFTVKLGEEGRVYETSFFDYDDAFVFMFGGSMRRIQ